MRWLEQLRLRTTMFFRRGRVAAQLDDELQFHLERQIAENLASGMSPDEARYAALRQFGNPLLLREQTRATWMWNWPEALVRDVRIATRTLLRSPGFAVVAILVIALGIGANVAMFTLVRCILLKPFPFRDQQQLLALYEHTSDEFPMNGISPGIFAQWRAQNRSFSDIALLGQAEVNLAGTGHELSEKLNGGDCTANFFSMLGVRPALGRDFTSEDDRQGGSGTVILTWNLWQRRFGGDQSILNHSIRLNGITYTVVGILPRWFKYPDKTIQLWLPIYHDKPTDYMNMLSAHNFGGVGRLKPGITQQQAVADLSLITHRIHELHANDPFISIAAEVQPILEDQVGTIRRPLYVLLAATGCVLLIACLNVANLLIARASATRKELAIKMAIGGGRGRILRERLLQTLLLSAAGGACGLLLASTALEWLVRTRDDLARIETVHIDASILLFTLGVIAFCGFLAGLISSHGLNARLLEALQQGHRAADTSPARVRLRKALLTAEVGLTVVLLIGAGLLLKSYARLRSNDLGCETQNVLTMRLGLYGRKYSDPAQLANFYRALLARVRALPGITAAAFVQAVPGQGYWGDQGFTIVEHPPLPPGEAQFAIDRWADPSYFATLGIPVIRGRTFDPARELNQADELVISAAFAKKYFPLEDPIGKHVRSSNRVFQIVGIVGDTRYEIGTDPAPIQYYPLYAGMQNNGTLVIRSRGNVNQFALPVQRVLQEMDPDLAVSNVLTMDQLRGRSTLDSSFNATLIAAFASLSLVLAAVGLFGVLSYTAAQRTSEIGIRIALGAPRATVLQAMLADGLKPAVMGLVIGLCAAAAATRLLRTMLYETQPLDAWVFAAVAATALAVAALACIIPAWRASRLDPMQSLRTE